MSGAAPILHEVFNHLHARYGTSWYDVPATITETWIDPLTGKRLQPGVEARARASGQVLKKSSSVQFCHHWRNPGITTPPAE